MATFFFMVVAPCGWLGLVAAAEVAVACFDAGLDRDLHGVSPGEWGSVAAAVVTAVA